MDYSVSDNKAFSLKWVTKGFRSVADEFFKSRPEGRRLDTRETRYLFKVAFVYSFVGAKGVGYCGITRKRTHPAVMQFHHVDPKEKDHDIGGVGRGIRSLEPTDKWMKKVTTELEKCVLLTADQHSYIHMGISNPEDIDSVFSKALFKSNMKYLEDKTMSLGLNRRRSNQHARKKSHPTGGAE